jgi:hypothetical protein
LRPAPSGSTRSSVGRNPGGVELGAHLLGVRRVGANGDRERAVIAQHFCHDFGVSMQPTYSRTIGRIDDQIKRHPPRREPRFYLRRQMVDALPAQRRNQHRRSLRWLPFGAIAQADTGVAIQPVDLVPHLDQPRAVVSRDSELPENLFDIERLCFGVRV